MLGRVVALEYVRQMGAGRTCPLLVSCEKPDGSVISAVAKFSDFCVSTRNAPGAEVVSPGALSIFTERFAAVRWRASTAIQPRGFTRAATVKNSSAEYITRELPETFAVKCVKRSSLPCGGAGAVGTESQAARGEMKDHLPGAC